MPRTRVHPHRFNPRAPGWALIAPCPSLTSSWTSVTTQAPRYATSRVLVTRRTTRSVRSSLPPELPPRGPETGARQFRASAALGSGSFGVPLHNNERARSSGRAALLRGHQHVEFREWRRRLQSAAAIAAQRELTDVGELRGGDGADPDDVGAERRIEGSGRRQVFGADLQHRVLVVVRLGRDVPDRCRVTLGRA